MTIVKVKSWPVQCDVSTLDGLVTLTRYTDPANNSDKYRRFITIELPGEQPLFITHTGRWTQRTQMNIWDGGTVRSQGLVSRASWNRTGQNHPVLHDRLVQQKRKDYHISGAIAVRIGSNDILSLLRRAQLLESTGGSGNGAATVTPVTTPAASAPSGQWDVNTVSALITGLVQRAQDPGVDPFDLFADLAVARKNLQVLETQVTQLQGELAFANEQIMARV